MNVVFHAEALEGMLASASYYEARSGGLGWDFLNALEQTSQRVISSPEAGPIWRGGIRKRLVAGFPFTLLYSIEPDQIFVVAVAHQSRRPGYWLKRVHG